MGYYRTYAEYLATLFAGKVQKISIDLGTGCPNRDGTKGTGGCIYCNNAAFSPDIEKVRYSVAEQLARGKAFFARKYKDMRYLAYFQSYTSTYHTGNIKQLYGEALADCEVVGAVISTRPDCLPEDILLTLKELEGEYGKKILIEFGVESLNDTTLKLINRGHDAATAIDAIERAAAAGFDVGVHLINGLPGETADDIKKTVRTIASLPVHSIKFHQLQILRGTPLAKFYIGGSASTDTNSINFCDGMPPAIAFTPDSYAALCAELLALLPREIAIDRFVAQAPADILIAPKWGLKNHEFTAILNRYLT